MKFDAVRMLGRVSNEDEANESLSEYYSDDEEDDDFGMEELQILQKMLREELEEEKGKNADSS